LAAVNVPGEDGEHDFVMIAAESEKCLKNLTAVIGVDADLAVWKVGAKTRVDEKDEGGARALRAFWWYRERNGVVFEDGE
jgi:hypothetical protein